MIDSGAGIQVDPGKVRAARIAAGLKRIIHAAQATGLDYKTIESYEGHNGSRPPRNPALPTLRKIAAAYNCTIRELVVNPDDVDRLIADLGGQTTGSLGAGAAPRDGIDSEPS